MTKILSFLSVLLVAFVAHLVAVPPPVVIIKAQISIVKYLSIPTRTAEPILNSAKRHFTLPVLEIFSPDGIMVYYSDVPHDIVTTLAELQPKLLKMKPLIGYISLPTLLGALHSAGALDPSEITNTTGFTLVLTEINGAQYPCEPCEQAIGALDHYIRTSTTHNNTIITLTVSN